MTDVAPDLESFFIQYFNFLPPPRTFTSTHYSLAATLNLYQKDTAFDSITPVSPASIIY